MIKRNESVDRDIAFEIYSKTVIKLFCFILLLALANSSFFNFNRLCIKMKLGIDIFHQVTLISLDYYVTFMHTCTNVSRIKLPSKTKKFHKNNSGIWF